MRPAGADSLIYSQDVKYCARQILADFWHHERSWQYEGMEDLCGFHSARLLPVPWLSARKAGLTWGNTICVSTHLSLRQYRDTIAHELVHVLATSPRYEWLNSYVAAHHDRRAFQEAVAIRVGRMCAARARSQAFRRRLRF